MAPPEDDRQMDRSDDYRTSVFDSSDKQNLMAVAFDEKSFHKDVIESADPSDVREPEVKSTEISQPKHESVNAQIGKKANRSKSRKKKGKK